MDNISLIRELNKTTIKKDEFEQALQESGFNLPPDEPDDEFNKFDMEIDDTETPDDEIDIEVDEIESPLEDDELQDIVDWCEEECSDMSDEELKDTLSDELEELDLSPEELDATISQVMSMLGHIEDDENIDDYEFGNKQSDEELPDENISSEDELY